MKRDSAVVWLMKRGNGKVFLDHVVLKRGNETYFSGRYVNEKYFGDEVIVKRGDEKCFSHEVSKAKGHRRDCSSHV
jgi:hypothetical protein